MKSLSIGLLFSLMFLATVISRQSVPTQSTPEEIAKLINDCGARTTAMAGRLYKTNPKRTLR